MSGQSDDPVALVTGGGSGIGEAIVDMLVDRGYSVVVFDTRSLAPHASGRVRTVLVDVSDEEAVNAAVEAAVADAGRLDAVVNNAGVSHVGSVASTSLRDWRRVLEVNLTGPFLVSKYTLPHLQASEQGSIVNICSIDATTVDPERAAYCAAKGGLLQLTRQMAIDYAGRVRVNAVSPGAIDTPLQRAGVLDARGIAAHEGWIRTYVPMGREGLPEEVAATVCFLVSNDASYITGANIACDGGLLAGRSRG